MKKILMFHQGAEEYGSDKIFYLSVLELSKENHVVVVLDSHGPLVNKIEQLGVSVSIMNLSVLRRVNLKPMNLIPYSFKLISSIFQSLKLIKKIKPDVIYVNTLAVISPLIASVFCNKSKIIHHLHEIQNKPYFLFRLLYTLSGLTSDIVLCVSQSVKDCFVNMSYVHKDKAILLYNGLPEPKPITSDKIEVLNNELEILWGSKSYKLISYVARIHTWKGQLNFLDVIYSLINDYNQDIRVAFFGDVFEGYDSLKVEIDRKVEKLGMSKYVHFFGFRKDADVLFTISDISIMGSIEPDPLPTVVLESFQYKTPVVAFDHGGSSEMIIDGETGFLITPLDNDEMSKVIDKIISNDILLNQLGENAYRRYLSQFSISSYRKNLSELVG